MTELFTKILIPERTMREVLSGAPLMTFEGQSMNPVEAGGGETIYNPTIKGGTLENAFYRSSVSGARVEILPTPNTGIIVWNFGGTAVFEVVVGGTNKGDVVMGDYTGGAGAKWDDSAGAFDVLGSITATSGAIGGWVIVDGYIYNLQSGTPTSSPNNGIVMASGNEGIIVYENTEKRLELGYLSSGVYGLKTYDDDGTTVLFETSDAQKAIAGWTLSSTTLANSTNIILDSSNKAISINDAVFGNQGIQLQYNAGTPRAYIGDGTNKYFNFDGTNISWKGVNTELTAAGAFTASSATITGTITATDGKISNWFINTDTIADSETEANANVLIDSANTLIRLGPTAGDYITLDGANQRIRSSNYSAGNAGFTMEPGLLETENIHARGKLSSVVFQYDVQTAVGGMMIVSNADKLAVDMTAADNSTLTIDGDTTFAVNDILRMKDGTDDEVLRVTDITSAPTYVVTRDLGAAYAAGANPAWKKGNAVVKHGSSDGSAAYSGGWLKLLGEGTNSPYYEVVKRTGVAYNAYTPYARLGNLNGFLDYSADEYGIVVGDANDYLSYDPTNKLRIVSSGVDAITIRHGSDILLEHGGDIKFTSVTKPTACTAALVAVAGNVDAGTHTYEITYVNVTGETELGTASNTVTNDATHKQNSLTAIPTSTSASVTKRKIYRTKAGETNYYLLTTIANNIATTYTDNTADVNLIGEPANQKENDTFGKIIVEGRESLSLGYKNVFVGQYVGNAISTGYDNVGISSWALHKNTVGYQNIAIGYASLYENTSGHENVAIGAGGVLFSNTEGCYNTALGFNAGNQNTTGNYNTFLGAVAGYNNITGERNVFIGKAAGYYETGSNKLFIDNRNRANEADARVKALMYGVFSANPASQSLRVNATLDLNSIGKIINVVDPVNPQDATTKNYVDTRTASYVKAWNSAATSLTDGNWITVALATEVWDIGGDFASNTFTAPTAGKYQFIGQVAATFAVANSRLYARIYKNGTTAVIQADGSQHMDNEITSVLLTGEVVLAANDTCVLQGFQDTGAACNTFNEERLTYLIVRRIST